MFLGMRVGIPMQGAGGLWSPYSASLAALLAEASSSGLVLDFTRNIAFRSGTQSTITGVSGFTYTRTGTAYDLAGTTSFGANTPRRTSAGLLVEAGGTNLLLQSQTLDNASWNKSNLTVTADTVAAPDGTVTADTITEDTTTASRSVEAAVIAFTTGTTYTFSVFAKAGTRQFIQLTFSSAPFSGLGYANFDLSNGTISATGGTLVGSAIQALSNGWYRCSIAATATASTSATAGFVFLANSGSAARAPSYLGGSLTVHLWGAQLETGATASSYVPTTTTSASRGADAASVNDATFLTALAAGGTIITRFRRVAGIGNVWAFGVAGTLTFDYVQGNTSGNFRYGTATPDLAQSTADLTAVTAAMGYTAGGTHSLSINGAAAVTSGVTTAPTTTNLFLGRDDSGGNHLRNVLELWAFLPRRASTAELAGASA